MAEKGMLNHCKWPAIELAEGYCLCPAAHRGSQKAVLMLCVMPDADTVPPGDACCPGPQLHRRHHYSLAWWRNTRCCQPKQIESLA